MSRSLLALALFLTLTGCSAQPAAQAPVEVTRVVKQEVTREVVAVHTQVVVVTATPEPASPTLAATLEPTATSTPTAEPEPTATPEPTAVPEPTVAEVPTVVPDPTAVSALESGEWVPGEIIRKVRVYDIPNESAGHEVINASPGDSVRVIHRGGQWYQVQGESASGETVTGWVYKDWIKIAPGDEVRLQPNPAPLPVLVSKIAQSRSNGYEFWSGTVMNLGAKTAYDVQVEITIRGSVGSTETRAAQGVAFVATRNLEPGKSAKFRVQTEWIVSDSVYYDYKVLWTER